MKNDTKTHAVHMIRKYFMYVSLLTIVISLGMPVNAAVVKKTDFNGDGKADLFLRNIFTGELSVWLINGNQVSRISYGTMSPSTGWTPIGIKDLNGDGRSDLLWYNVNTGNIAAWLINGSTILQKVPYGKKAPNKGWTPIGLDDFNGDGRGDVLWYNAYTGGVVAWLSKDSSGFQAAKYGAIPINSGWAPIGIKDLNGDGRSDLLWYNANTGGLIGWLINGSNFQQITYGTVNRANGWVPMGADDFNGDGRTDLLLYNIYTGDVGAWLMNGNAIVQAVSYGNNPINSGWIPLGLKDINGDKRADLLWYNVNTGAVFAWLINGASVLQGVSFGTLAPSTGWIPTGLDDFNGDGRADLFWQNAFTNETKLWLLNGSGIQSVSLGSIPPSSVWQVQIPR